MRIVEAADEQVAVFGHALPQCFRVVQQFVRFPERGQVLPTHLQFVLAHDQA